MATRSAQTTVDTTAGGTRLDSAVNYSGGGVLVKNQGAVSVYLGTSGVTTSTGYILDPGESVAADLGTDENALYGITGSSSAVVHVLQVGRD